MLVERSDELHVAEFAPTRLLILQPTPFCNIDCSYCYLPNRSSTKRLTLETVRAVIRFLTDLQVKEPLTVCWHAGEPLVVPASFYEQAFQEFASSQIKVQQNIQTNGTLINDEWCHLFKKWSVQIGLSMDGPETINDTHRLDRTGRGTFKRAMGGLTKLRERGVPFSLLAVLTRDSLDRADEIWSFFKNTGACHLAFNIDEKEGAHKSSSLETEEQLEAFRRFMSRIADLHEKDPVIELREIRDMRSHLTAPVGTEVAKGDNQPGTIWNIDCDGNVTTFSPELLGQKHARYGTFSWGNVHTDKWTDVARHPGFQLAWRDIKAGVDLCRRSCQYFSVCGGGCPSNKLAELDTFFSSETRCCRFHVQAVADLMIERLERRLELGLPKAAARTEVIMGTGSTDGNRSRNAVLYIVGAGIRFPEHLTVQTIEILSGCKRICTNLHASHFTSLPEDIRIKCKSLWPLYQDKRHRSANYRDVAQAVLDAGERESPIAWMTQGHPIIFDSVSQLLLRTGRARGWQVSVLPAISSLDTILAELGYDPANGFFVHEATALVRRHVPLQPAITTLLLQPSLFGSDLAHLTADWRPDLAPLRDYLLQFYAKEQECGFIRSSTKPNDESTICWTKVGDITAVAFEALASSSLLLPSATIDRASETNGANSRRSGRRGARKSVSSPATS